MSQREKVLRWLTESGVRYRLTEHPAVYTIDEMIDLGICAQGTVCKNLFLRDAKGRRHFLVMLISDKRADLPNIQEQLGCTRLSFASADRLSRFLGLSQGEVTPLGIINDTDAAVEVVIDRGLVGNPEIGLHPNDNTATVWLSYDDLVMLIKSRGNAIVFIDL